VLARLAVEQRAVDFDLERLRRELFQERLGVGLDREGRLDLARIGALRRREGAAARREAAA
jgi:hypothetical protein